MISGILSLPKNLKENKDQSEEKTLFSSTIQTNADWLQPMLRDIVQPSKEKEEKSKEFTSDLEKIFLKHEVRQQYEKKPEQLLYLTWIKMLDPKIDQHTKEKLCLDLAERYRGNQSQQSFKPSIGGTLTYMPSLVVAPILLYSPIKILSAYYEYQNEHGKYFDRFHDLNFETTLKFLLHNKMFPKETKTFFLKKIMEMLKQRMQTSFNRSDTDYLLHEAMASWEKNLLIKLASDNFDKELTAEYAKFKEKVDTTIENSEKRLELRSEFGSLVFERLLVKHQYNAETLAPIVSRFTGDQDLRTLSKMYTVHGLDTVEMFERHLIQLAKWTNEPDHYEFSSLFFNNCLKYLENKGISLVAKIASSLSPAYFAKNSYAFDTIRKEMFLWWINNKPEQIVAIVKAILSTLTNARDIDHLFFELDYIKMSDSFYEKLAILLSNNLTPAQFITFYSNTPEPNQRRLLSALIADKDIAFEKLKELSVAYHASNHSVVFPREIINQLETINPILHKKLVSEKLFVTQKTKDDLETDLHLLKEILENKSLTSKYSEIRKLDNLYSALRDKKTDTCPTIIKMFDSIPQEYWPALFVEFDAQIMHWSFPYEERELRFFEKKPEPRKDTWLSHKEQWEKILYGTLVESLVQPSATKVIFIPPHFASLSQLDQAFTKSETHFPGLAEELLKKFFLENIPNSIKFFSALHDKYKEESHPSYFSHQGIYDQVASWLPEDSVKRTALLATLLQMNNGFEPALHTPFVRNKEEVAMTAMRFINTRTAHIVNVFDKLRGDIKSTLFKTLNQFDGEGFLKLLQAAFSDVGKANLPLEAYMNHTNMLLSFSKNANINIFQIIDADPNKDFFIKTFSDVKAWQTSSIFSYPYSLIFNVVAHYQPEQLLKIILEHVQECIKESSLWKLCDCINAAQIITHSKLELSLESHSVLVDYLTKEVAKLSYYSQKEMEVMADFVPNFDKLFFECMTKELQVQHEFSRKYQEYLDNLVRIYGFSHVNTMCLEYHLKDCSDYLVEKFARFPYLLQQMDKAVELYDNVLNKYEYKLNDKPRWSFNDKLRTAIVTAVKESKKEMHEIDIAKICAQAGIPSELIALMPPLRIKSVKAEIDEMKEISATVSKITIHEEKSKSPTALMAVSWKKNGLMNSPSSSTDVPSLEESPKKQKLSH